MQPIAHRRLLNQHIADAPFDGPAAVVQWLGAVQAQDYAAAAWALGLRSQGVTYDDVEQAFTVGLLLRTHVMRPTWHFVSPADIRWLLALTAPRVKAASASYYRKLELDDAFFAQSNALIEKALQGGQQLTRSELALILQQAGIVTDEQQRLTYIMMRAELDGIVCSGARRGKQFTYALLDERAPQARMLDRDEAMAELAGRYFSSHGPATLQDFVWWSGLTVADAKAGLAMIKSQLIDELIDGQIYWFAASTPPMKVPPSGVYLLPNYDEYTVGYTDRSAIFDVTHTAKLDERANILFNHIIVLDGQVVGTWKRTLKKGAVIVAPDFFTMLDRGEMPGFTGAVKRYGEFLGLSGEFWAD